MNRVTKLVILAAGLVFGCTYFLIDPAIGSAKPGIAVAVCRGPGEIFAANCAKCHGADGRAKTAKGKRAGATDFTSDWNTDEARGIRIITNGKGEMPSFKRKLSADEIRSVFGYVLRFKQ